MMTTRRDHRLVRPVVLYVLTLHTPIQTFAYLDTLFQQSLRTKKLLEIK